MTEEVAFSVKVPDFLWRDFVKLEMRRRRSNDNFNSLPITKTGNIVCEALEAFLPDILTSTEQEIISRRPEDPNPSLFYEISTQSFHLKRETIQSISWLSRGWGMNHPELVTLALVYRYFSLDGKERPIGKDGIPIIKEKNETD